MAFSLGAKAYAWRGWLVALLLLLTATGFLFGRNATEVLEPGGFEVSDSETTALEKTLQRRFGQATPGLIAVYEADGGTLADARVRAEMARIVDRLEADPAVKNVASPLVAAEGLVSTDGERWLVTVDVAGDDAAQQDAFPRLDALLRSPILDEAIGGKLAALVEAQQIARDDLFRAEIITIPVVAILLVVFFRGFVAALLPLLIGAFSIAMSLAVLRLLGELFTVSLFALNIVTFLGLGLAVDYALFMVQRFREELGAGNPPAVAVRSTVSTAGKTITYSGLAVAASLLGLMWVPVMLLRSIAVAGTLVVILTNVGAVVLLPAVLALLGRRVGGIHLPHVHEGRGTTRFWRRSATTFMRWPWLVGSLSTALLVVCGLPFLRMQTAISDARVFPPGSEVREVYDITADTEQFPDAGVDAHLLMVRTRTGEPMTTPSAAGALFDLDRALRARQGVEEVWSAVGGIDDRSTAVLALSNLDRVPQPYRGRMQGLLDDDATLVRVASAYPSASDEAHRQVHALERLEAGPLEISVTGRAAHAAEVRTALSEKLPYAAATVAGVTFVMLLLAFGAPIVALKAVMMNVLSLSASFGALVWVFQDGRFEDLLGYASVGAIDPTVPVMMFAIVFGLSMDYELFLLSRIKEQWDRIGDNTKSVAEGLTVTGPIITSAAVVLLAVIAGLVAGSLIFLKELGVGMALAIIIDVTLIRVLLVPATMALLGRWNWWAPRRLLRWWRRTGIGVAEGEARRLPTATGSPEPEPVV